MVSLKVYSEERDRAHEASDADSRETTEMRRDNFISEEWGGCSWQSRKGDVKRSKDSEDGIVSRFKVVSTPTECDQSRRVKKCVHSRLQIYF